MTNHSRSKVKSTLAAAFSALLAMTALSSAQSTVATLSGLAPSAGALNPAFASGTTDYTASVAYATTDITVTPTATDPAATITVNSVPVTSGSPSGAISLNPGTNPISIVVTAEDTTTTKTYTLTVTRETPNVDLSDLLPSAGTLAPAFASATTDYTATVPYATNGITVTPTAANGLATITVNGAAVTSGNPSGTIPLSVGSNTITTVVTGQDAVTTKTYTLTVTRETPNVDLSDLLPSAGTLSPVFASGTTDYTATVPTATTGITVTPTAVNGLATITVNGVAVTSGNPSDNIPLSVGSNTITTVVTGQDAVTTKTYTLTVTRAAANVNLASLVPSVGTLAPAFASGTTDYSASVPYTTTGITVTPTAADGLATITVNGAAVTSGTPSDTITLSVGANTITTVVTGQDAVTTKTYTLTVTRETPNVDLSDLLPSAGTLSPAFASGTTDYTATVPYATTGISVTPTAANGLATITVDGAAVTSGNPSGTIPLSVGSNTITTVVTGQDGVTTKTYTLTVTRNTPSADLSSLLPSAGTLTPAFASGTTDYTATVPTATTGITVTPTASDGLATITVNGAAVTSGNPSGTIALSVGANTITIVVTAQDAVTTKTYTLTVTRETANVNLSGLVPSAGTLTPAFASGTTSYTASVPYATTGITVTPTAADGLATITVNGAAVTSGTPSGTITLSVGANTITTVVTGQDAVTTKTYTLTVTRLGRTLFSAGAKTSWDTTTANWGTVTGGPYTTATWNNSDSDSATFEGAAGTVTLGEAISIKNLTFTNTAGTYTITGSTLNFTSGTIITNSVNNGTIIQSNITGAPPVNASALNTNEAFTFRPAAGGSITLGVITGAGGNSAGRINFEGGAGSNSVVAGVYGTSGTGASGPKSYFQGSGTWTLTGLARGYENWITSGELIISTGTLQNDNRGSFLSGGTLHLNNNLAIKDNNAGTQWNLEFYIKGGNIDNTSGAPVTLTLNPGICWGGDWTFIGSNGANSNLNMGTGGLSLYNDGIVGNTSRKVTVTNPATTLTIGGVISGSGYSLTKAGDGTMELRGANTYTGATKVNVGTLKLGASGALAAAGSVSIAAGATLDLTEKTASSATYTWNTTSLGASGAATPATITGDASGTIDMGIKPISLTTDGTNPSLTVTGAALTLGNNPFTVVVPGPALKNGIYTLVSAPSITGTVNPTASFTGGNGLAGGATGLVSISSNTVILTVAGGDETPPTLASIVDDKSGGPVTVGTLVTYTVTFSEDMDAATVTAADFNNAGTAAVTIGSVTETAPTSGVFTVLVTPTSAGSLILQIPTTASLTDASGNPLDNDPALLDDTTITVQGGSAYDAWAGGALFDADANNDGVDNGLAWVLGATDKNANAIALLPTLDNTSDPDFFIFTYRRDDDANTDPKTTIKAEYGSTLTAWATAVAGADIIITPTDEGAGVGIDLVQVKIRRTLAVGGKLFARLNVVNTP